MDSHAPPDISTVLQAAAQGDPRAASQLLPLLYQELRVLAHARRAQMAPGQTLQTTELVHEAYLKVVGHEDPGWSNRGHFFAAAGQAMRQILVDQARRKNALKRGGGLQRSDLAEVDLAIEPPSIDVLALDEAMTALEREDPRKGKLVTLHFFAGLTLQEVADVFETSLSTVEREWRFTRALLHARLSDETSNHAEESP